MATRKIGGIPPDLIEKWKAGSNDGKLRAQLELEEIARNAEMIATLLRDGGSLEPWAKVQISAVRARLATIVIAMRDRDGR